MLEATSHGYDGYVFDENMNKHEFKDCKLPMDLEVLGGDARQMYPDYLGCCKSIDDNFGKLVAKLKEKGLYEE